MSSSNNVDPNNTKLALQVVRNEQSKAIRGQHGFNTQTSSTHTSNVSTKKVRLTKIKYNNEHFSPIAFLIASYFCNIDLPISSRSSLCFLHFVSRSHNKVALKPTYRPFSWQTL